MANRKKKKKKKKKKRTPAQRTMEAAMRLARVWYQYQRGFEYPQGWRRARRNFGATIRRILREVRRG